MKGTKIHSDTLEDNLICDDLFFEYFSTFLSLPCFPSRVCYNRLTGGIELIEVEDNYADENPVIFIQWAYDKDKASLSRRTNAVGYTEERRQRMLLWAAEDRLPLFQKSPLHREFKLCRYLLKPVDNAKPRSGRVRGYSLDTDAVSSLTTAAKSHSAGADAEDSSSGPGGAADDWFRQLASAYRHMRPSSQAISLPPKLEYPGFSRYLDSAGNGNGKESAGGSFKSTHGGSSHRFSRDLLSHPSDAVKARSETTSANTSEKSSASNVKRPISGRQQYGKQSSKHLDDSTSQGSYYNRVVSAPSKVGKSVSSVSETTTEDDDDYDEEDSGDESDDEKDEDEGEEETDGQSDNGRKTYLLESSRGEHRRTSKEAFTAVSILERKHGRSMQEIKDQLLGNLSGMQSFRAFLEGTLGAKLYDFWLDVERFKDDYEPVADQEDKKRQRQLYRNILDLYGSLMTEEVRSDLHQIFSDSEIDRTTLNRPQYGALRRLRVYWVPRYILHRERLGLLRAELGQNARPNTVPRVSAYMPLSFPTLSLGSWVCSLHAIGFWTMQGGPSRSQSRTSIMAAEIASPVSDVSGGASVASNYEPSLRDKLISALMYETLGGGPLARFARRDKRRILLSMLNFHRDVAELSSLVTCLRNDRMLRRERYWSIYNKYISPDGKNSTECPGYIAAKIHSALSFGDSNSFLLKPTVFAEAQLLTIDKIMPHWIDFLKSDALTSLSAICVTDVRRDPTSGPADRRLKPEDAEFIADSSTLVIKLHKWVRRYVGETPPGALTPAPYSGHGRYDQEESLWDAASQARWRKWLSDQRRSADRLRKEALRAAHARLAAQKAEAENQHRMKRVAKPKPMQRLQEREDTETVQLDKLIENKTLGSMFRRALDSVPDISELLGVYTALLQYSREEPGSKRDHQAVYIYKQYLDPTSTSHINLETTVDQPELRNSLLSGVLIDDTPRPPSPALHELRRILAGKFTMDVQNFVKKQAEQLGMEAAALMAMTPDALKMRMRQARQDQAVVRQREGRRMSAGSDDDLPMLKRGEAAGGKAPATREDRAELTQLLTQAAYGPFPRRLVAFRRYICYFADHDKMPLLENDLLYCIEAIRFKTACHPDQDEQWLKRKLSAIVDTYMDATTTPNCQIDVPSDMNDRMVKSFRRAALTLEFSPGLVEEMLQQLLNSQIFQYYAGFRRILIDAPETEDSVLVQPTRKEKALIQRHRQFEDFQQPPARKINRLPPVPERGHANAGIIFSLHFSIADGAVWKEQENKNMHQRFGLVGSVMHSNKGHTALSVDHTLSEIGLHSAGDQQ